MVSEGLAWAYVRYSEAYVGADALLESWRAVGGEFSGSGWQAIGALLDDAGSGPLNDFLRAELLLAANSPRAEVSDILPILALVSVVVVVRTETGAP